MFVFHIRVFGVLRTLCNCCMYTGMFHLRPGWQRGPAIFWSHSWWYEKKTIVGPEMKWEKMRSWSGWTFSSWRRTRSGIRVSFRPSTVKWFSASLSRVVVEFVGHIWGINPLSLFSLFLISGISFCIWNAPFGSHQSSSQEVCTLVSRCKEKQQQGSRSPSAFPTDHLKTYFACKVW